MSRLAGSMQKAQMQTNARHLLHRSKVHAALSPLHLQDTCLSEWGAPAARTGCPSLER